ncbi:MAG: hypothetical protein R3E32_26140 [Chitinophagales bacterium]
MRQLQFYKIALLALVFLNIGTIAFMALSPHPPHSNRGGNRHSFLQETIQILDLDAEQEILFKESANAHNQQVRVIEKQQAEATRQYFTTILEANDTLKDSLMLQLQQLEQSKIVLTYKHFEEVKSILKPEQQNNFQAFLDKALQILLIK